MEGNGELAKVAKALLEIVRRTQELEARLEEIDAESHDEND